MRESYKKKVLCTFHFTLLTPKNLFARNFVQTHANHIRFGEDREKIDYKMHIRKKRRKYLFFRVNSTIFTRIIIREHSKSDACIQTYIFFLTKEKGNSFATYLLVASFFFFEKKEHHSWHIHMHQTRKRSPENLRKKFMRFELKNDFAFCVLLIVRLLLMIVVFYCVISFVHMLQAYSIWWKDAMNRNCKKLSF